MHREEFFTREQEFGNCPKCGKSWDGGPIPEEYKEHHSPPYRYSLLIGLEDPKIYDGVSWWRCPHCGETFDRFKKKEKGKR